MLSRLAWPVVLGQLGWMGIGIADVVMSGRLGEDVLAAVSIGHIWSFGVLIMALGVMRGLDPVFAQAHGAGDHDALERGLAQGVVLSLVVSVPVMGAMWVAEPVLLALGQPAELVPIAATYCRVSIVGMVPALVFQALTQFLQGQGVMRPPMIVVWLINVVNVVLNGVMMFGWFGGVEWGAVGCAWSSALGRWLLPGSLVLLAWPTLRRFKPPLSAWLDAAAVYRFFKIGAPIGGAQSLEVWAFNGAGIMAGWLGPTAIAGHSVAVNIASVSFMVPFGLSAAAATRVGNLVGADRPWIGAAWTAMAMGGVFMAASGLCLMLFPEIIGGLYTDDASVLAVVAVALPLAALFQLFDGLQTVANGILRGVGDTRFPAVAVLIAFWILGLPAGWYLGIHRGGGVAGIWTGLVVGLVAVAILLVGRVRYRMARGAIRITG